MSTVRNEKIKQKTKEELREILAENDTVYTVLRHVSRSGMYRVISFYVIKNDKPVRVDPYVVDLLDLGYDYKRLGCRVRGGGMDMGYHVVCLVSYELFGDGYRSKHAWL